MIGMLKGIYDALSLGFYLSQVAERHNDPAHMREALTAALNAVAEEAETERPADKELVAA